MKLNYFNLPGKAEAIRLTFIYGGIPFEDNRSYTFASIAADRSPAPFGQLPFIDFDDGTKVCQSAALLIYAGQITGIFPKDIMEQVKVIQFINLHEDLIRTASFHVQLPKEKRPAFMKSIVPFVRDIIGKMNDFIAKNGENGFAIGNKITTGDFLCYGHHLVMKMLGFAEGIETEYYDEFTYFKKVVVNVIKMPEFQDYFASLQKLTFKVSQNP